MTGQSADPKHIENVISQIMNEASSGAPNLDPGGIDRIEMLAGMVAQLEQGLVQVSGAQQTMALAIDTSRLAVQMILRVLMEKEVISEEDAQAQFKKEVTEPILKIQEKMNERIKEAMKEDSVQHAEKSCENNKECSNCSCAEEEEEEEENDSDVVLASEKNEVKKY